MAKSEDLHLKSGTRAKAIPRHCQNGHQRRSWYEETDEAQLSMYQPNPDFREPQAKEDIVSLAIAQSQECDRGAMGELNSGPNAVFGKGLAAAAVNQTNLVIVAGRGRQLPRMACRVRKNPRSMIGTLTLAPDQPR
jgi:hypothetical protein